MLTAFQKFTRTIWAKLLLGVLVVSFAFFGVSSFVSGVGNQVVARVGSAEISSRDFQRGYSSQMSAVTAQLGQVLTTEQAMSFGIPGSVLSGLAAEASIDEFSRRMGLGVTRTKLNEAARADPAFAGVLGAFEPENFRRALANSGFTETEYWNMVSDRVRRDQVAQAIFVDAAVPKAAQDIISRYNRDTRNLDYVVITPDMLLPPGDPTDADLTAYLTEHQAEFRTLETRTIRLIDLSPDSLAANVEITDAQIEAEYERTRATRTTAERRTIRQLVLPNDEIAATFDAGLAAGRTFEELATEVGLAPVDLGTLARANISDTRLADAAFATPAGSFTIIPGIGGRRAIAVTAIEAAAEVPLAEAREEIRTSLALAQGRTGFIDALDVVEELRAAFTPIEEIAGRLNLTVYEVDLTTLGQELSVVEGLDQAGIGRVATAVFDAEQGNLTPTVRLGNEHNVWFDLVAIEQPRDQTLDEVREAVTAAWRAEQTNNAIDAEINSILEAMRNGGSLVDVAAGKGQFTQTALNVTRAGDGSGVINDAVAQAAFGGGVGHFGSAVNGNGGNVVFQVSSVTPATTPITEADALTLSNQMRNTIYQDFVAGLTDAAGGLSVNQAALVEAMNLVTGTP